MTDFDPRRLSASRLNSYLKCGKGFEAQYIKGRPRSVQGGAALFGTVMHAALEKWSLNRRQSLVVLVESAWLAETLGTSVRGFVQAYAPLSLESRAVILDIQKRRPEVRAPRSTKDFKNSKVSKDTHLLFRDWLPKLNSSEDFRFSINDPLPTLYDDSLVLAERYAKRMRHLPPSLVTEFAFEVEWQGFWLNGFIDSIEPLVDRPTGELVGLAIVDYKTSNVGKPPLKYYRQLGFYDIAVEVLLEQGKIEIPDSLRDLPVYPGIDWVRWTESWLTPPDPIRKREFLCFGPRDRKRLRDELEQYERGVSAQVFLPSHPLNDAQFCDYGSACCLLSTSMAGGEARPLEGVVT